MKTSIIYVPLLFSHEHSSLYRTINSEPKLRNLFRNIEPSLTLISYVHHQFTCQLENIFPMFLFYMVMNFLRYLLSIPITGIVQSFRISDSEYLTNLTQRHYTRFLDLHVLFVHNIPKMEKTFCCHSFELRTSKSTRQLVLGRTFFT